MSNIQSVPPRKRSTSKVSRLCPEELIRKSDIQLHPYPLGLRLDLPFLRETLESNQHAYYFSTKRKTFKINL
jgi:hypothetical protein